MSEPSSNSPAVGFVRDLMRSHKAAVTADPHARARKAIPESDMPRQPNYVAKVMKKAAQLSDVLTDSDTEQDLRVLREAKQATHLVFDPVTRTMVERPDHKTRLAATQLSRAYVEGLPVAQQVVLTAAANFKDNQTILLEMVATPSGRREALRAGLITENWLRVNGLETKAIDV